MQGGIFRMNVVRPSILITCLVALAISAQSTAHPVHPCLAKLSELAATLKDCELAQAEKGQCSQPKHSLEAQTKHCRNQQFTPDAVNNAVDYGYASLEGDVGQSPYRRQVRKMRWESSLMKPNIERFNSLFADFSHIQEDLTELFNRDACPKQYQGSAERFLYFGSTDISRYASSEADNPKPTVYTVHWFARENKGQCYPPQAVGGELDPMVVNLPERFLEDLAKGNQRSVRCESASCEMEITELETRYQQYQQQYRLHRQLLICSDIDQRNENRKVIKGQRRSAYTLPEYCPQEEIQVQELNARGLLEQMDQSLFQDVTIRFQTAKSE